MKWGIWILPLLLVASMTAQAEKVTYSCVALKDGKIGLRMTVWGADGYPTDASRFISTFPGEIQDGIINREGLHKCWEIAKFLNENKPKD